MRTISLKTLTGLSALVAAGTLSGCIDLSQPFSFNLDPEAVKNNGPYTVDVQSGANGTYDVSVKPNADTTPPPPTPTTIALSWAAPTTRVNGAALALSDIAAYNIKYGTTAGSYGNTVKVSSGATTSYTLTGLAPSTYYIVINAVDTQGNAGPDSTVLTKTLQ